MTRRFKAAVEDRLRELCAQQPLSASQCAEVDRIMTDESNWAGYHQFNVVLAAREYHTQDQYTSLCHFEHTIMSARKQFPWIKILIYMCDGAPTFHASMYVLGAPHISHRHGLWLQKLIFNASGHGKSWADQLFGKCKGKVRIKISMGMDVPTGEHFVVAAARGMCPSRCH